MSSQEELRSLYPHGHPMFTELTLDELRLHSDKNYDYAHGGDPLGNFKRVSRIKQIYPNIDWTTPAAQAIDYSLKQIDAVLYQLDKGYEGQVEGIDSRAADVHVYWKIFRILLKEQRC